LSVSDDRIPSRDEGREAFNRVLAQYDGPAYLRRARRVQDSYDGLLEQCRLQREVWLAMARVHLGMLRGLAGDWPALVDHLADEEQLSVLEALWTGLQPRLRVPVEPTVSTRALREALCELNESLERFNRRWTNFVRGLDLSALNAERADYNRYYLLEKECAVRSPHIARQGYRRMEQLTAEYLLSVLPPLPVPRPRGE
jgi:hypothetical protein